MSQNWTGSDIILPDCTVDPTDSSCTGNGTDPANQRMANLYTDDIVSGYSCSGRDLNLESLMKLRHSCATTVSSKCFTPE